MVRKSQLHRKAGERERKGDAYRNQSYLSMLVQTRGANDQRPGAASRLGVEAPGGPPASRGGSSEASSTAAAAIGSLDADQSQRRDRHAAGLAPQRPVVGCTRHGGGREARREERIWCCFRGREGRPVYPLTINVQRGSGPSFSEEARSIHLEAEAVGHEVVGEQHEHDC